MPTDVRQDEYFDTKTNIILVIVCLHTPRSLVFIWYSYTQKKTTNQTNCIHICMYVIVSKLRYNIMIILLNKYMYEWNTLTYNIIHAGIYNIFLHTIQYIYTIYIYSIQGTEVFEKIA